jgi:hypothetical protein
VINQYFVKKKVRKKLSLHYKNQRYFYPLTILGNASEKQGLTEMPWQLTQPSININLSNQLLEYLRLLDVLQPFVSATPSRLINASKS